LIDNTSQVISSLADQTYQTLIIVFWLNTHYPVTCELHKNRYSTNWLASTLSSNIFSIKSLS